jgi:hypothetical protein
MFKSYQIDPMDRHYRPIYEHQIGYQTQLEVNEDQHLSVVAALICYPLNCLLLVIYCIWIPAIGPCYIDSLVHLRAALLFDFLVLFILLVVVCVGMLALI